MFWPVGASLFEVDNRGEQAMPHIQSTLVEVKRAQGKGRGVFARTDIPKGTIIERVPVVILPVREVFGSGPRTRLAEYAFAWGSDKMAIACGYGSLYNHSYTPNARFYVDGPASQVFAAIRNIRSGEEVTVNYDGRPRAKSPVTFQVA